MDVNFPIKKSILQIMPVVGIVNRKRGRKIQKLPILLKQYKKYVLINKWLIKNQRDTTNVRGVKIKSIGEEIMNSFFLKSKAKGYKDDYTEEALKARYILMRRSKSKFSPAFNNFRKKIIRKSRLKTFKSKKFINKYIWKSPINDLKKILNVLFFLKFKKKNWFIRKKINEIKKIMFKTWNSDIEDRILLLGAWARFNRKKMRKIKKKLINYRIIEKIVKRYEKERGKK